MLLKDIFANEYLIRSQIAHDQNLIEDFSNSLVASSVEISNLVQTHNDLNALYFATCSHLNSLHNPSIPSDTNSSVIESGKKHLSSVISQKTVANTKLSKELNEIIDQLTDYSNQISHFAQNYSRVLDKARADYEQSLQKFMATPKKKRLTIASSLLDDKLNFIRAVADSHRFHSSVIMVMNSLALAITNAVSSIISSKPYDTLKFTLSHPPPIDTEELASDIRIFKQNIGLISGSEVDVPENVTKGIIRGYMWKRSKGPRKSWSRRYFFIKNNQLCTKQGNQTLIVMEDISNCLTTECEVDDRPYVFECIWGQNSLYLQAEGDLELKYWLLAFLAVKSLKNVVSPLSTDNPSFKISRAETFPDGTLYRNLPSPSLSDSLSRGKTTEPAVLNSPSALKFTENQLIASNTSLNELVFDTTDDIKQLKVADSKSESNLTDKSPKATHRVVKEVSRDWPLITGVLAMKELKPHRRLSAHRDYSHVIWRTAAFSVMSGKLFTTQSQTLQTQKELVDLHKQIMNRHFIQECDESLFSRKHVFSITTNNGPVYYFAASSANERQRWVQILKKECHGWHHGADGLPYRVYRSLNLRIIEGRNLNGEIYCEVYMNADLKARTPSRKGPDHFWRNDYTIHDIYSLRHGITIVVMGQSRMRDVELGRIVITQAMFKSGETEAWYPVTSDSGISSMFSGSNAGGDLKIRFKYEEEVVLSMDQYQPLMEILGLTNPVVYELANAASDLETISFLLLNIHDAQGESIEWLKFLISDEIERTDDANVLFRGNSILTKAMDAYMKLVGMEYLEDVLGNVLREIVDEKVSCEVDPTRVEKKETLKYNWQKLMGYAIAIWNSIEESKTSIPRELRILFNFIQKKVGEKFGNVSSKMQMVRFTSVSGFLFLRLFCPCILNPKLFGLTKDYADIKTSRTLTLLAKTLQCLANLASFGVKEPYMVDMNAFIMDHVNGLMEFIDHICSETSNTTPIVSLCVHDLELYMSQLNRMIRIMVQSNAIKDRIEPLSPSAPMVPPRSTSKTLEIASSQIEELISNKLL